MSFTFYTRGGTVFGERRVSLARRELLLSRSAAEQWLPASVRRVQVGWDGERIAVCPADDGPLKVSRDRDARATISMSGFFRQFPAARKLVGVALTGSLVEGMLVIARPQTEPFVPPGREPVNEPGDAAQTPAGSETPTEAGTETLPPLAANQRWDWRCAACGHNHATWRANYKNRGGHPQRCPMCRDEKRRFERFVLTLKKAWTAPSKKPAAQTRPVHRAGLRVDEAAPAGDVAALAERLVSERPLPSGMRHRTIYECVQCNAEYPAMQDCVKCPGTGDVRRKIVQRRMEV